MDDHLNSDAWTRQTDSDNVRVVIRVRPLLPFEIERNDASSIEVDDDGKTVFVNPPENSGGNHPGGVNDYTSRSSHPTTPKTQRPMSQQSGPTQFTFNKILGPENNQCDVFEKSGVKRMIHSVLEGFSATVFAYGQTGSGKTFTITGDESGDQTHGLVPRSVEYLFQLLYERTNPDAGAGPDAKPASSPGSDGGSMNGSGPGPSPSSHVRYTVRASYLEIYNENVRDLLNLTSGNLGMRWSRERGFYVENLFVVECEDFQDLMAVVIEGMRNRVRASHAMNSESSRSHAVLTIHVDAEYDDPLDGHSAVRFGKLTFVDLAGSERLDDTKSQGITLTETGQINKSLFTLGTVISALSEERRKGSFVPYRDSKLTKLLMDSLGGSSLTLMIACCSPSDRYAETTLSTLQYARRTKRIKNKPVVHMDARERTIADLRRQVRALQLENAYLRGDPRSGERLAELRKALGGLSAAALITPVNSNAAASSGGFGPAGAKGNTLNGYSVLPPPSPSGFQSGPTRAPGGVGGDAQWTKPAFVSQSSSPELFGGRSSPVGSDHSAGTAAPPADLPPRSPVMPEPSPAWGDRQRSSPGNLAGASSGAGRGKAHGRHGPRGGNGNASSSHSRHLQQQHQQQHVQHAKSSLQQKNPRQSHRQNTDHHYHHQQQQQQEQRGLYMQKPPRTAPKAISNDKVVGSPGQVLHQLYDTRELLESAMEESVRNAHDRGVLLEKAHRQELEFAAVMEENTRLARQVEELSRKEGSAARDPGGSVGPLHRNRREDGMPKPAFGGGNSLAMMMGGGGGAAMPSPSSSLRSADEPRQTLAARRSSSNVTGRDGDSGEEYRDSVPSPGSLVMLEREESEILHAKGVVDAENRRNARLHRLQREQQGKSIPRHKEGKSRSKSVTRVKFAEPGSTAAPAEVVADDQASSPATTSRSEKIERARRIKAQRARDSSGTAAGTTVQPETSRSGVSVASSAAGSVQTNGSSTVRSSTSSTGSRRRRVRKKRSDPPAPAAEVEAT